MNKSIQYFLDNCIDKMQKRIKNQIRNGMDIGEISKSIQVDLLKLGTEMIREVLEEMDKELRISDERKRHYEVVFKRPNSFLTKMGEVTYERTCFKKKKGKGTAYLVDNIFGISPHENIASDVEEELIEEAVQTSYRKSGEDATNTPDTLTKQTVMNYIKKYDFRFPLDEKVPLEKKKMKIIYIEADEDHVALQKGGIVMPKLIYIHEGIQYENYKSKRKKLINTRYFTSTKESHTELWERVLNYIYETYDWDYIEKIYIAGDGASWIKAGTKIIDKSKFVLDKYHLKKYTKKASAHMDEMIQQMLHDALDEADKAYVKVIFEKIIELTPEETRRESVHEAQKYIFNNWDGIQVYEDDGADVIGCSAEGHISHIYSSRLSSRPKGWSEENVENMANLIVYKLNGGKIVDIVKLRRMKEEKKLKLEKQKEKQKIFHNVKNEFYKNISIPVLQENKKN